MRLAASVLLLCHTVHALCKKRECTEFCTQVKTDIPLQVRESVFLELKFFVDVYAGVYRKVQLTEKRLLILDLF